MWFIYQTEAIVWPTTNGSHGISGSSILLNSFMDLLLGTLTQSKSMSVKLLSVCTEDTFTIECKYLVRKLEGLHVSVSDRLIIVIDAHPTTIMIACTASVYITAARPPTIVIMAVRAKSKVIAAYVFQPSAISMNKAPEYR